MTRAKKIVRTAISKKPASKATEDAKKITWVTNDNCCLLYAMWETLNKKQQDLLTVRESEACVNVYQFI